MQIQILASFKTLFLNTSLKDMSRRIDLFTFSKIYKFNNMIVLQFGKVDKYFCLALRPLHRLCIFGQKLSVSVSF